MGEAVRRRYEAMAQSGELQPDESQRALADRLDDLLRALGERARMSKRSALGWLFSRGRSAAPPRGLYIWGDVGRGKTLLMDLFFRAAPGPPKRRVHFHEFMREVHESLSRARASLKSGEAKEEPIVLVAVEIATKVELLCFDEFAVHDIADAMLLRRLFEQLFERGVVVVATSNAAPRELYKEGLNRALFLPFITLLEERMAVFHLEAPRDYRLDSAGSERRYVTPLGPDADRCLAAHFRHLTGCEHGKPTELVNKGRRIIVPEAARGVARFAFADLCRNPLGPGDYLQLAGRFHTFIIADLPVLGPGSRDQARRIVNLVDTLYDNRNRLIVSAEAEPEALLRGLDGPEAFEFARTASRLVEMRSDAYWEAALPATAQRKTARAG